MTSEHYGDAQRSQIASLDLAMLRAFVALAHERSFTRAASVLNVQQSTITRQVQRLEHIFDAHLLVRTHRGIVLTFAGERILQTAQSVLQLAEGTLHELKSLQEQPRGVVRIGSMMSIGSTLLSPVIARLKKRFNEVTFVVQEGLSTELALLVGRGELDLAIFAGPVEQPDLVARRLWVERYFLAVAKQHGFARRVGAIALDEAVGETFASLRSRAALFALEQACRRTHRTPKIAIETDNLESVRSMVEANICVALLPNIIRPIVERWHARCLEVSEGNAEREVVMAYRGRGHLSASARALRDELLNETQKRLYTSLAH